MSVNSAEALIARLIEKPPATRVQVEAALGAKLTEKKMNPAFTFYEGALKAKDGTIITIDFREPNSLIATAGALLAFDFQGQCYARGDVDKRFGPVKLIDVPRGHSEREKWYYGKTLSWGDVSFGYLEKTPNCLNNVVFSHNKA